MFGLTIEKLFVVAVLAAIVIGPQRLPDCAAWLGALVRRMTLLAVDARQRVTEETDAVDWHALDPRQYDPRRIIREAWADAELVAGAETGADAELGADAEIAVGDEIAVEGRTGEVVAGAMPAGRWVVAGSSAHPRRVWVPAEE
ncbi:Sec-independent protein translocase protein TatB [Microbacterium hydrocarbonoxydans]|jgi:sec-independent protein translocase protein TatB|uniref:Sec-independent protein translocase protein TatB n=1 Tax=Microbacterium hydrocarbonoxydans TaxID=273678 RepID=A0A0M2HRM1_9MICO|nr:hypothetical protein [Microbacterium hydrocarbonoxydans]KJL47139.1 Sec-independent protein translocase protein TatB [Microbacterium hydrocarbonoxydans]